MTENGVWLRLALTGGGEVIGFVAGAQRPADLWSASGTQLVCVESARERSPTGKAVERDVVFVNRDHVEIVEMYNEKP
jgi:hypothetical protein